MSKRSGGRPNPSGDQQKHTSARNTQRGDHPQFGNLTPSGDWRQLPTLTAFSDANGWNHDKYWRSIHYANLDGSASGQQEVVARGPNGVVVYKYNTTGGQWDQLPSSIRLTDDPWGSNASYYATLHLGDASGDGRQDTLIARGPYGGFWPWTQQRLH